MKNGKEEQKGLMKTFVTSQFNYLMMITIHTNKIHTLGISTLQHA